MRNRMRNRKLCIFTILISFLVLGISTPISAASVSEKSNSVKISEGFQIKDYYCGPAAAQIVIKTLSGDYYDQDRIVDDLGTTLLGTSSEQLKEYLNGLLGTMYTVGNVNQDNMWLKIRTTIDYGYPVIYNPRLEVLYPYAGYRGGHFVVGTGYHARYGASVSTIENITYYDVFNPAEFGWANNGVFGYHTVNYYTMYNAVKANFGQFIY